MAKTTKTTKTHHLSTTSNRSGTRSGIPAQFVSITGLQIHIRGQLHALLRLLEIVQAKNAADNAKVAHIHLELFQMDGAGTLPPTSGPHSVGYVLQIQAVDVDERTLRQLERIERHGAVVCGVPRWPLHRHFGPRQLLELTPLSPLTPARPHDVHAVAWLVRYAIAGTVVAVVVEAEPHCADGAFLALDGWRQRQIQPHRREIDADEASVVATGGVRGTWLRVMLMQKRKWCLLCFLLAFLFVPTWEN